MHAIVLVPRHGIVLCKCRTHRRPGRALGFGARSRARARLAAAMGLFPVGVVQRKRLGHRQGLAHELLAHKQLGLELGLQAVKVWDCMIDLRLECALVVNRPGRCCATPTPTLAARCPCAAARVLAAIAVPAVVLRVRAAVLARAALGVLLHARRQAAFLQQVLGALVHADQPMRFFDFLLLLKDLVERALWDRIGLEWHKMRIGLCGLAGLGFLFLALALLFLFDQIVPTRGILAALALIVGKLGIPRHHGRERRRLGLECCALHLFLGLLFGADLLLKALLGPGLLGRARQERERLGHRDAVLPLELVGRRRVRPVAVSLRRSAGTVLAVVFHPLRDFADKVIVLLGIILVLGVERMRARGSRGLAAAAAARGAVLARGLVVLAADLTLVLLDQILERIHGRRGLGDAVDFLGILAAHFAIHAVAVLEILEKHLLVLFVDCADGNALDPLVVLIEIIILILIIAVAVAVGMHADFALAELRCCGRARLCL
eukprot:comp19923_c0_seq1/m.38771 comp19923_c0_seq1/g.38771  ORF comp19923_c0_seq1/g.38771 comp19923_c0_seq1/m.38771 type:complete len:492 (+) comp19923_c0_seq1:332-1807(+)